MNREIDALKQLDQPYSYEYADDPAMNQHNEIAKTFLEMRDKILEAIDENKIRKAFNLLKEWEHSFKERLRQDIKIPNQKRVIGRPIQGENKASYPYQIYEGKELFYFECQTYTNSVLIILIDIAEETGKTRLQKEIEEHFIPTSKIEDISPPEVWEDSGPHQSANYYRKLATKFEEMKEDVMKLLEQKKIRKAFERAKSWKSGINANLRLSLRDCHTDAVSRGKLRFHEQCRIKTKTIMDNIAFTAQELQKERLLAEIQEYVVRYL